MGCIECRGFKGERKMIQENIQEIVRSEVFRFIYVAAMRDAVLQGAYEGERKWLQTDGTKEAMEKIQVYISKILNGELKDRVIHDKAFLDTAKTVCEIINRLEKDKSQKEFFTFGNAQKLINMTVKYIYINTYNDLNLRENFCSCHCPMDRVLLKVVWKECIKNKGDVKSDWFLTSWGKENWKDEKKEDFPDRYACFQNAVINLSENFHDGKIYPVEYDFLTWGQDKA